MLIPLVAALACTSEAPPQMASVPTAAPKPCARGDARVRALVRSGHTAPSLEALERTCTGVESALREIAADRSGWGLERLRSIELLAAYPSAETQAVLGELATASDDLTSVRRTALVALGASQAPISADLLAKVDGISANDADAELRAAAAQTALKLRSKAR